MRVSAVMATFPARKTVVGESVTSLINQVDEVYVVANQCSEGEIEEQLPAGANVIIPPSDLKDTGKFYVNFSEEQFVLLCDDDIIYPPDYVERLRAAYAELEHINPVIGVHGVTYSDVFDGAPSNRIVHVFHRSLEDRTFVNQLGTGTVLCKAYQMPPFSFMQTSARFVDLRFAVHCQRQGYPRVCIEREAGWMKEVDTGDSLFESFTKDWPVAVTREAQEIAGLRFLPLSPRLA